MVSAMAGLVMMVFTGHLTAEIELPPIFTNGMVLQADMPLPIWGKANPGETVPVRFAGQTKTSVADAGGRWRVNLDPLKTSAQSYNLKIGSRTLTDVVVGEVWLCAGQSNMQWLVGKQGEYPGVEGGEAEIAGPGTPGLRIFSDPKEPDWQGRGWKVATGADLRSFSATGYFFGQALQRELGVPVGIINVSRGGSSIQSWIPSDFGARTPLSRRYSEIFQQHRDELNVFNEATNKAVLARKAGKSAPFPSPLAAELAIANRFGGSTLFDELVEPLASFATKGVIWYQGESNADFEETAKVYDSMLRDLIEGWRYRRDQASLPWYVVQLPCWNSNWAKNWPWIRQGQLAAASALPDVHLTVTCDIGDGSDLHPPQKRQLGKRLAMQVLADQYGRKGPSTGPVVRKVERKNASLYVNFDTGGGPLHAKDGQWKDLEVAGPDGAFQPATASTIGETGAEITSETVPNPVAIRYGWAPFFQPTLFNSAGFPASPFSAVLGPDKTFHLPGSDQGAMIPVSGERWCAIGDSITHAGGYLKTLYLYSATRFPGTRFDLINCGSGGDTAGGALARRMDTDILPHKPSRSTLMFGINDVWWEHTGAIRPGDYIRNMSGVIDRLHQVGSSVVLIAPPPYDDTAKVGDSLDSRRSGLEGYVKQLRDLAKERAIPIIDVFQTMKDMTAREQAANPAFSLMEADRVHPTATGAFILADTILRGMGAPAVVSRVSIDSGGRVQPFVENATIKNLSREKGAIAFDLVEDALPFPVSGIPTGSLKLTEFTRDLNQQIFQVRGLPEGRYQLAIDRKVAGIFSAGALENGVNLASIPDTPQNIQASKVAELIEKRTEIVGKKLRHIAMIEYGELKKSYPVDDAVTPAKDLEGSGKSYPEYFTLKPQQSKLAREAKDLDDRIWKTNQPVGHQWRLTRAGSIGSAKP